MNLIPLEQHSLISTVKVNELNRDKSEAGHWTLEILVASHKQFAAKHRTQLICEEGLVSRNTLH